MKYIIQYINTKDKFLSTDEWVIFETPDMNQTNFHIFVNP